MSEQSSVRTLSLDEAAREHGVRCTARQMPNGEYRFKLECETDNSAYVRTAAGATGAWQNSHVHERVVETYLVQSRWMIAAELAGSEVVFFRFGPGVIYQTAPGVVHNIYLPARGVIHTVKHGEAQPGDWIGGEHLGIWGEAARRLDLETRGTSLSEDQLCSLVQPYPR